MRELPVNGYYLLQIGLGGSGGRETKEAVRKKALEIREAAINGQSFNQLAATYSDLPSAVDGGDIGVVKENEMAPDMLKGVQALQPGDISPVMETPAGFIFFKLLGVNRDGTIIRAPFDSIKEEIFSLLRNEEQERLYSNWVKELREEAYIKELL
jgi:peptidyl-prolyl cis-trans isomerase SurA